jgi:anaerobic selenocysteine-containing dehydrogenase
MFGRRELKSLNSWLHNSPRLNPRLKVQALLMHPDDAQRYGLGDGGDVLVESKVGRVSVRLSLTTDVVPGSVCLPHGHGHNRGGGWQRANATGGPNANLLTESGPGALEPLAAMRYSMVFAYAS